MSVYADECADVYDERFPKARRLHRCHACQEEIHPGHQYARIAIVYGGSAQTVKRCMRCQRIHEHLRKLGDGEMWPMEGLNCGEDYTDHWGKEPPPEIAALAFALPGEVK